MFVILQKRFLILFGIFLSGFSATSILQAKTKEFSTVKIPELEKLFINKNRKLLGKNNYEKENYLQGNFLNNLVEDAFEKLIANNPNINNLNDKFLIDIEANVQSQTKDLFNAEGNVILYFYDATLKSDKVVYDRVTKEFSAEGNVVFAKGDQYFEASKLFYNFKTKKGSIKNVYGVLDFVNFGDDFELNKISNNKSEDNINKNPIRNLNYISASKFGLTTNFSEKEKQELKDLKLEVPSLNKWRFKTDILTFDKEFLMADRIFFTNDPFNKPQFIILSKNFKGELIEDKVKFISKNTWINFDDKINAPIGRWSISDRDKISNWFFGSDYDEKDGFYIARDFEKIKLSDNFFLDFKSYFLLQRALKGNSNSFRESDYSLFSDKVKNDIFLSDVFSIDANLVGKIDLWDINLKASTNTLNIDRSSEAIRSKLTFSRSIDLNKANDRDRNLEKLSDIKFENFVDLEIYSSFREKINKGYDGEAEIYYGNGLSVANRKSWINNYKETNFILLYSLGDFKAESKSDTKFFNTSRNLFVASIDNRIRLWEKKSVPKEIDESYKFTPQIIKPSIVWNTAVNSGLFFYGDGSSQEGITFRSGPDFIFGSLKKNFFDFSRLSTRYIYVLKSGQSPFAFDDINSDERLYFQFDQQVFGPLIFSFQSYLPLEAGHKDYGDFTDPIYQLEIKRRAYSLAIFYNQEEKDLGYKINIFNFDFSGKGNKF